VGNQRLADPITVSGPYSPADGDGNDLTRPTIGGCPRWVGTPSRRGRGTPHFAVQSRCSRRRRPHIAFESRKNGPGEVSVLFGLDILDSRIDELGEDETWDGYLFPSPQGQIPHVTRDTIRNWFKKLASEADLPDRIEGERPSPQLCRRFWYDTYTAVLEGVLEGVEEIAAEQGSSDPQVVMQNYLSDSRSRQLRREFMREQLMGIFRGES